QVRVKGINLQSFDVVPQNDVVAVIGKGRACVDVGDGSVRGGHDGIRRLAVFVALQAANVDPFVDLPAVRTDATEGSALPGFPDCADEKSILPAFFKQGAVGGGQLERLSAEREGGEGGREEREERKERDAGFRPAIC